jgi:SAM-dependent methyltransferase
VFDADTYREEALARWERAAPGWAARRDQFQRFTRPVSVWMIDHLGPQPGHTLLELAAGTGDTGLLAAELVQPGGRVIITDLSEAMVEAARRRAEELGLRNVETRVMHADWIDLPTASVDGVLCRFGYMLLADPLAALQETRRVLRPGGRVALAAWGAPEDNPWSTTISGAAAELGLTTPHAPDEPGPFRFAAPGTIERLLDEAGFDEVLVESLDLTFEFESTDAHFDFQRETSPTLLECLPRLSPADHARLRDASDARVRPYVRADGSVRLPARTWVAVASA